MSETGAHVRRVGLLSEALAAALGWPVNQTDLLRMAAPMHDIGKIGIPDAIPPEIRASLALKNSRS